MSNLAVEMRVGRLQELFMNNEDLNASIRIYDGAYSLSYEYGSSADLAKEYDHIY